MEMALCDVTEGGGGGGDATLWLLTSPPGPGVGSTLSDQLVFHVGGLTRHQLKKYLCGGFFPPKIINCVSLNTEAFI